jgi:hypothetical protein
MLIREDGDRVGLVYCWSREIDAEDRVLLDVLPCTLRGNVYAALMMRNFVSSGAPLVRKTCVEAIGGYDPSASVRGCEDWKFNLDIAERFEFDLVPEFLFFYRVRAGSISTDFDAMLRASNIVIGEARARHPELPRSSSVGLALIITVSMVWLILAVEIYWLERDCSSGLYFGILSLRYG